MKKIRGKNAYGDGSMMYSWNGRDTEDLFDFIESHYPSENMHRFLYDPKNDMFYLNKYGFNDHADMASALNDGVRYDNYFRGYIGFASQGRSISMLVSVKQNLMDNERYLNDVFSYYEFLAEHGVNESVHKQGLAIYDEWYREHINIHEFSLQEIRKYIRILLESDFKSIAL